MKTTGIIVFSILMGLARVSVAGVPGPVVTSQWLAQHQKEVLILDVRKDVKSFTQKPVYVRDKKSQKIKLVKVAGHIPGARLVDYGKIRADRMIDGKKVQKLILEKGAFETLMQSVGLNKDSSVVIVSKGESNLDMTMATRLYWQLKYYGHDDMAILDGGMAQWLADKRRVSTAANKTASGNWVAGTERKELLATSQEVATAMEKKRTQLMDTRPVSQYWGTFYKKSYVYAGGHIPGAVNFPNELMTEVTKPSKFLSKDAYRKLFEAVGIDASKQTISYCNSGHLASGGWFILSEIMGNKDTRLYDGSMHQWTQEKRPVDSLQ